MGIAPVKCSISKCSRQAEIKDLCNIHHYRKIWLDNSDINNLGIVSFAEMVTPTWARNHTAEFQKEVYYQFFQLYSPDRKDKYDRLLAEIAFRGAAKTTAAKILLLYLCCFGLEKFVVYCSETNTFAVQDVFEVRKELSSNPYIKTYFGVINSKKVQGQDGEWSRDAFLTATGVYVLARGVGQQVRSALRNSYRPTLAIINDMYSKDSVKTEYTRAEYQKWFFQDLFNGVDDIDGKVFFNGTILHEDTVPVVLKENSLWKVMEYPIMNPDEFQICLNECSQGESSFELPSAQSLLTLEQKYQTNWSERLSLKYILTKYKEAYESHQTDGFYQEYFHIVVPPTAKQFINRKYCYMRYFRHGGYNWLAIKFHENQEEIFHPVKVYFGVDPASSTTSHSKYSVIAILMMNQKREVFYYGYSRGRFGLRDELREVTGSSDLVEFNRDNIARTGIVDEEIRLARRYFPNGSQIETTQAQQHIFTEVSRLMRLNNALHPLYSDKPMQDKIERDAETLVPDFQTSSAYINYGLPELDLEFKSFPRGTTIDIIDAFYHARKIARPAEPLVFSEVRKKPKEDELITDFVLL